MDANIQGFSREFLSEIFTYDPATGKVFRTVTVPGRGVKCLAGSEVGSLGDTGYLHVRVRGKIIRLHRLVFFLTHGDVPAMLDHRDRNKLNNRIDNLRACNRTQNGGNASRSRRNTSGFRGVCTRAREKGLWCAQITLNGKTVRLGRCATKEEAARLYDRAARQYFGEFASVNYAEQEDPLDAGG